MYGQNLLSDSLCIIHVPEKYLNFFKIVDLISILCNTFKIN